MHQYTNTETKRFSANTSAKVKQASNGSQQPGRISLIWIHEVIPFCLFLCIFFSKRQRPSFITGSRGSSFLSAFIFLSYDKRCESSTSGYGAVWHLVNFLSVSQLFFSNRWLCAGQCPLKAGSHSTDLLGWRRGKKIVSCQ